MNLAILIMVSFLFGVELAGLLGLRNTGAMNAAAKKIARELYELQKPQQKDDPRG